MAVEKALLVLFYFGVPLLLAFGRRRFPVIDKVGVVTLSYLAGILLGNTPGFHVDAEFTNELLGPVIMLAIPLLLFSTRITMFRTAGPQILKAFLLGIVAVAISASAATWFFSSSYELSWQAGAMTFGVYTGGTVNLSAIGLAIGADENMITLVSGADLLWGGLFLLFLLTAAKTVYGFILGSGLDRENSSQIIYYETLDLSITAKGGVLAFLLAVAIVAVGLELSTLIFGEGNALFMFLSVTALGILASLSSRVRELKGSYFVGDFLINVFCVMIGSLANIQSLLSQGGVILSFVAAVMFGSILLHLILARLFGVGSAPVIIASTAGLYGPPFVPPIARAIGAPHLIPLGVTLSLVGFAVGNYGGIALGQLFRNFFS